MRMTRQQARKLGLVPGNGDGRKKAHEQKAAHALFDALCKAHGLEPPVHEYEFCEGRKWRADYLFNGVLIVERVGGVWKGGHHSRGQSQLDDMERRNEAQILGYMVLEFSPQQLDSGAAFGVIKRALGSREEMP